MSAAASDDANADDGRLVGSRLTELLPDALDVEVATSLRNHFDTIGYQRYRLIDRGTYEFLELSSVSIPALQTLIGKVSAMSQRELVCVATKVIRLRAGDYLLAHHDGFDQDLPIELTVDISQRQVANAELVYLRRGQAFYSMPSQPRCAVIVERGPAVNCYHRYVSKRSLDAEIVRIVLKLTELRCL